MTEEELGSLIRSARFWRDNPEQAANTDPDLRAAVCATLADQLELLRAERDALLRDREATSAILFATEEAAADLIPQDEAKPHDLPGIIAFPSRVYRAMHWINSPTCRKNHLDWEPKPGDAAQRAAKSAASEERV
jgi:hypothetical protein